MSSTEWGPTKSAHMACGSKLVRSHGTWPPGSKGPSFRSTSYLPGQISQQLGPAIGCWGHRGQEPGITGIEDTHWKELTQWDQNKMTNICRFFFIEISQNFDQKGNWQSVNGLALNRWKVITWNNTDQDLIPCDVTRPQWVNSSLSQPKLSSTNRLQIHFFKCKNLTLNRIFFEYYSIGSPWCQVNIALNNGLVPKM